MFSNPTQLTRTLVWLPVLSFLCACGVTGPSSGAAGPERLAQTTEFDGGISPGTVELSVRAGSPTYGSATQSLTVNVPAVPAHADILLAIDTTSSMQPSIDQAKRDALNVVADVQAMIPDARFAVVDFRDAVDGPNEYIVRQGMTGSAAEVKTAIEAMSAEGGGDEPEAYNLVFRNSYQPALGGDIGWREDTRKFVVVIGDAPPHGVGNAGIPGCFDMSADPHGLSTATELAGMAAAERTLLMILQTSSASIPLRCYQGIAARGFTGGQAVEAGGDLAQQIVELIRQAFSTVQNVHLEVRSAGPAPAQASWVSFNPASVGPIQAPSSVQMDLTTTPPAGAPPGTYTFDVVALADGSDIGHTTLTLNVVAPTLVLSPATATLPAGGTHTVTATLADRFGGFADESVSFVVTGGPVAVPSAGQGLTNAQGQVTFTFANQPAAPGTNQVQATRGALSATAAVTWMSTEPPGKDPDCSKVTLSRTTLRKAHGELVEIQASGEANGTIVIYDVWQDEKTSECSSRHENEPDAKLACPPDHRVWLRAERSDDGDGRVYHVSFRVTAANGKTCEGKATVGVPKCNTEPAIDSGPPYFHSLESTAPPKKKRRHKKDGRHG